MRSDPTNDPAPERWFTAAECAHRTGLTVRALRVYERRGLIAPRRTDKRWRLYGPAEMARLHAVVALKRLGLSLAQIQGALAGGPVGLADLLGAQASALRGLRERTDRSLAAVAAAQAKLAGGASLSIHDLATLIRETDMDNSATDPIALRRWEQARPRNAVPLDPSLYAPLVGHYRLATGSTLEISADGERLFVQVLGQPRVEMFAEAERRFFLKATPAQITFDGEGPQPAAGLVLHQGGFEMPARRIDEAQAQAARDALAARIQRNEPTPGAEAALRGVLDDLRREQPAYDRMTEPLAAATRQQLPLIVDGLVAAGPVEAIAFRGVSAGGWDVFQVTSAKAVQTWRIQLTADGRIGGLLQTRPEP